MKTNELLTANEAALVSQLRVMKAKELERHATKLLKKAGADYAAVLAAVTRAIPDINASDKDAFGRIQAVIRAQAQAGAANPQLLERVAVIMMIIIKKQFLKIHHSN